MNWAPVVQNAITFVAALGGLAGFGKILEIWINRHKAKADAEGVQVDTALKLNVVLEKQRDRAEIRTRELEKELSEKEVAYDKLFARKQKLSEHVSRLYNYIERVRMVLTVEQKELVGRPPSIDGGQEDS